MLSQTIDQLLPVLQLVAQPAFCVRQDGTVLPNPPASAIAPQAEAGIPVWLGGSAQLYAAWDHRSHLHLPVDLSGKTASAAVIPLIDGTLFLLSQCAQLASGTTPMSVTAQVLRQPLTDLVNLSQQLSEETEELEDPLLIQQSTAITRQVYRLTRIACNLADLERLQDGTYTPQVDKLDLNDFLENLMMELDGICQDAGRQLICQLPDKALVLHTDAMLLERALLNLISNALKYSPKGSPIRFSADLNAHAAIFQIRNTCTDQDLLTAAFHRLEHRGLLPDPKWGLGLGLPLTRYIAQLLGGTVAVEVLEDTAIITMTVSRKKNLGDPQIHMPPPYDYTGGMRHSLVELSDSLPNACFDSVAL